MNPKSISIRVRNDARPDQQLSLSAIRAGLCIALVAGLLGHFIGASAADETTQGVLAVSMTILPSCEVRVNVGAPFAGGGISEHGLISDATVTCPLDYPFRAGLAYGATPVSAAEIVYTGTQRINLPPLFGSEDRDQDNALAMLIISY